ncbi:MAG: hypothetical protein K6A28_02690 [Bacteroidales bacterium]|nr:hypothetical protein [Bacteroidales bacterium]
MKSCPFNVVDINSIIFISNEKQPSLFKQLCIFFAQLLYYTFFHRFKYKSLPSQYQGIVFFGVSINNQRSLDPIVDHLGKDEYLYLRNHKTDVHKRRAYWLALPYLPNLIKTYRAADAKTKPFIKKYFTRLWSTYGYYQLAKEYLERYQIKVLVLSSDQGEFHRCLLLNAKQTGTKTIYVQHASVAKGFPKLIASYSFLDGRESLEKYLYAGQPEGEVYLSGGVRFDPVFRRHEPKKREQTHRIGIAINMLDDFAQVKNLCGLLLQKGFQLILRPHPRYGAVDTQWLHENGIGFSDPKEESSFDFISRIDLMVSNESSIHLDAALMRCPSIVYNFSNNPVLDYYSYIKSGLTRLANDGGQLVEMACSPQSLAPSTEALQYFNASTGTPLESTLGETLARFVRMLSHGNADAFDETYGFHQTDEPFIHVITPKTTEK